MDNPYLSHSLRQAIAFHIRSDQASSLSVVFQYWSSEVCSHIDPLKYVSLLVLWRYWSSVLWRYWSSVLWRYWSSALGRCCCSRPSGGNEELGPLEALLSSVVFRLYHITYESHGRPRARTRNQLRASRGSQLVMLNLATQQYTAYELSSIVERR
jgi:hypothetical protein